MSSLSGVKTTLTEHHIVRGEWPKSLKEIGYSSEAMTSNEIEQVRLGQGGRIIADLVPFFGEDKRLALAPVWIMDGSQIQWQCAANYPKRLLKRFGSVHCESRRIP